MQLHWPDALSESNSISKPDVHVQESKQSPIVDIFLNASKQSLFHDVRRCIILRFQMLVILEPSRSVTEMSMSRQTKMVRLRNRTTDRFTVRTFGAVQRTIDCCRRVKRDNMLGRMGFFVLCGNYNI